MEDPWEFRILGICVAIAIVMRFISVLGLCLPWEPEEDSEAAPEPLTVGSAVRKFTSGIVGAALVIGSLAFWYMAESEGFDGVDLVIIRTVLVVFAALLTLIILMRRR